MFAYIPYTTICILLIMWALTNGEKFSAQFSLECLMRKAGQIKRDAGKQQNVLKRHDFIVLKFRKKIDQVYIFPFDVQLFP